MPVFEMTESVGADGGDFEKKEWPIIPEDTIVNVELLGIKEEKKPFTEDNGDPIFGEVFEFVVTDGEYEKSHLWGNTPTTFTNHPDCKLRNWLQEVLGQEIEVGDKVNAETVVGSRCRVVVGNRSWNDKVTGEKKTRHFAKDVLRSRQAVSDFVDEPF